MILTSGLSGASGKSVIVCGIPHAEVSMAPELRKLIADEQDVTKKLARPRPAAPRKGTR